MQVRMLRDMFGADRTLYVAGQTYDLADGLALSFIGIGAASDLGAAREDQQGTVLMEGLSSAQIAAGATGVAGLTEVGLFVGPIAVPDAGLPVYNPGALAAWRRRRGFASAPTAVAPVVWCFGDSITHGQSGGSAGADGTEEPNSWVGQLMRMTAQRYGAAQAGWQEATDDRVTAITSASAVASVGPFGGSRSLTSGTSTLTFNVPSCTNVRIVFFESNGTNSQPDTGTFSWAVDGGGATTVADTSQALAYRTVDISGLAATSHTVTVTGVTGTTYVCGVHYWTQQATGPSGIAFSRVGRPGWNISDLLGFGPNNSTNAQGQARLLAALTAASPALVILSFGHNDANNYTPATFRTYLSSAITQITATGCPVLLLCEPAPPTGQESGTQGLRADYWDQMIDASRTNTLVACAKIDDLFGGYVAGNAAGLYGNGVHPSIPGYGAIAQGLAAALL